MPTRPRLVTTFEHELLRVGDEGESRLSPHEAQLMAGVGEARPGFCSLGHHTVKLAQYVGLVNMGDRVLEVLPKVGAMDDEDACRGTILRLLRMAHDLPLFSGGSTSHDLARGSLLDVFAAAFLDATMQLVRAGLLRRYREEEEDLGVLRGRLLLKRQVSALSMRPDRLACRFDDMGIDNARNQVLKAALLAVRRWVQTLDSHRKWLELNAAFDEVAVVTDPLGLLTGLVEDRQATHYRAALRWAEWILRLLTPNVRGGSNRAPELLFDMNRLFEDAVAGLLHRRARRLGLRISAQDTGRHLGVDGTSRYFRLRPDLVLWNGLEVLSVADTKWSEIQVDSTGRLVPAESHVYQLNAYASVYPSAEVVLIYPWHSGLQRAQTTSYDLQSVHGRQQRLHIVCLDVGRDGLPARAVPLNSQLGRLLA